jgi:3-oxoacyl-[acyl-carrier-protein] synthase II
MCTGGSFAESDPLLAGLSVDFSCPLPDWDADKALGRRLSRRLDRATQMAVAAAREAVADAGLEPGEWDPQRVAVLVGAGTASFQGIGAVIEKISTDRATLVPPGSLARSLPSAAAGEIALDLRAHGPSFAPAAACASGAVAIGLALQLLRSGSVDLVVAGGTESGRLPIASVCFSQMGALSTRCDEPASASRPFDASRDGFVLGEGAGILLLERASHARARSAPSPRAYLSGYGGTTDAYHWVAPHPEGRGLREALQSALRDADMEPREVDHVNAHGTGTMLNDAVEAGVLRTMLPHTPPVTAPKGALGHALGAGGAIEAALTVLTLERQLIPPTANLNQLDSSLGLNVVAKSGLLCSPRAAISNSAAFGGHNAVLAFRAAQHGPR